MTSTAPPKLSIHAKERCHSRKISTEEVEACISKGERKKESRTKESIKHGDLRLIQSKKDSTVVTAIRENVWCHKVSVAKGEQCMKSGLIQSMREQLSLLIKYSVEGGVGVFEISGHKDDIQKAINRIENTNFRRQAEARSEIRVASPRNVKGHIIGKGGSNLKSIRKRAKIMQNLRVRWDATTSEMVVSSTILLDEGKAKILKQAIENIVKEMCG